MDDTILETISNIKLIKIQKIFLTLLIDILKTVEILQRTTHPVLPIITKFD